jgi:hypothetical protein
VVQPYQTGAGKILDLHGIFILCARVASNPLLDTILFILVIYVSYVTSHLKSHKSVVERETHVLVQACNNTGSLFYVQSLVVLYTDSPRILAKLCTTKFVRMRDNCREAYTLATS